MNVHGVHGPRLQAAMFADGRPPPIAAVVAFAHDARLTFAEVR
jgi:hypothetical protein